MTIDSIASKTISNPDIFKITDKKANKIYFGCDQEWFPSKWQRLSGCGPTAASNIVLYLNNNTNIFGFNKVFNNKEDCLSLMQEVWEYVTPTLRGIHTIELFYESLDSYFKFKNIKTAYTFLNIPKEKSQRSQLSEIINFIKDALSKDVPIAFLNLSNGKEKNLDPWHWVTITSIEYTEDKNQTFINILDEGQIKKIDLALWYSTTSQGGGFVYFILQ
ncbi:MAG: hypothetical protein K0S55_652 [Clostridia bacterium]|jgi:hypothetical protein|nr:hypothetical protein [Clostridia bacterium]